MKGILIINKEKGKTSHDVVNDLRRILQMKRIGHTGTLDPLAIGVLPMCIGRGTRVAEYIQNDYKEYVATAELGYQTDTLDITGDVLAESDKKRFHRKELEETIQHFIGEIEQYPPMYSAIRVKGKRLYEYAREGKTVERKPRKVTIHAIEILDLTDTRFKIKVLCSTGTYIRTLVDDIGKALGSYATMTDLVRTRVGEFQLQDAHNISDLREMTIDEIEKLILPLDLAVAHFPKYVMDDQFYKALTQGQALKVDNFNQGHEDLFQIHCRGQFIGMGYFKKSNGEMFLRMKKVLI